MTIRFKLSTTAIAVIRDIAIAVTVIDVTVVTTLTATIRPTTTIGATAGHDVTVERRCTLHRRPTTIITRRYLRVKNGNVG